jgi:hypothetical protein
MSEKQSIEVVRQTNGYGVVVNGSSVANGLTARKAQRRARGLESRPYVDGGKSGPIMDETGRCLSRKERGMPPKKSQCGVE